MNRLAKSVWARTVREPALSDEYSVYSPRSTPEGEPSTPAAPVVGLMPEAQQPHG